MAQIDMDAPRPAEAFEMSPPSSIQVVATWERYETRLDVKGDKEKANLVDKAQIRSHEIKDTVYDFGGLKNLVSSVYEAAPLVELMERLNSRDQAEAQDALDALKFYNSGNQQDTDYVRAISADMLRINAFIDSHLASDGDGKIPLKDVLELVSDVVSEDVKKPEGVNIESILIAAASAYNTLHNAKDITDVEVLRAAYAAKNFFGPLLEIIGYDAFGAALKEAAGLTDMTYRSGEPDVVTDEEYKRAQDLESLSGVSNPEQVVNQVMGLLFLGDIETRSVLHNASGHDLHFGTGVINDLEITAPMHGRKKIKSKNKHQAPDVGTPFTWRKKTLFSLAEKFHKKPDKAISDVLGITVILPDYEGVAEALARAYASAQAFISLEPTTSASKISPIHINGKDIAKAVLPKLANDFQDEEVELIIDQKQSTNGYQAAKITLLYQKRGSDEVTPIEIAFQTIADREISRAGPAAHAFKYKGYDVSAEDLRVIKRLHERRTMTTEPGLTKLSQARAEELFSNSPGRTIRQMASVGIRHFIDSDAGGVL